MRLDFTTWPKHLEKSRQESAAFYYYRQKRKYHTSLKIFSLLTVINSKSENIGVNLIINLESLMLEIRTWIVIEHRARKFELGFFTRPVLTPGRPGNFQPGIPISPTKIIFCARIIYLWIDLIKISILSKNHNI